MNTRNERLIETFENYDSLKHYIEFNTLEIRNVPHG